MWVHSGDWLPVSSNLAHGPPAYGMVLLTFGAGLLPFFGALWRLPQRHTQKCALHILKVLLIPTKLIIKISHSPFPSLKLEVPLTSVMEGGRVGRS